MTWEPIIPPGEEGLPVYYPGSKPVDFAGQKPVDIANESPTWTEVII